MATVEDSDNKNLSKHNSGTADLESITDFVEEAEIKNNNLSSVSTFYMLKPLY